MDRRTRWIVSGLLAGGSLLGMTSVGRTDPPGGSSTCIRQLNTCTANLATCTTDLEACEAAPRAVFPGDGVTGPALSYTDNGDGTFTDNNTQLMWEKKDDGGGVHDKDNTYTWTDLSGPFWDPNGTLFRVFLATLNTSPCFAGHCDWRIPNVKELQSLVNYAPMNPPASTVPGETSPFFHWSSTPDGGNPSNAWAVGFNSDSSSGVSFDKNFSGHARAVRGGS